MEDRDWQASDVKLTGEILTGERCVQHYYNLTQPPPTSRLGWLVSLWHTSMWSHNTKTSLCECLNLTELTGPGCRLCTTCTVSPGLGTDCGVHWGYWTPWYQSDTGGSPCQQHKHQQTHPGAGACPGTEIFQLKTIKSRPTLVSECLFWPVVIVV